MLAPKFDRVPKRNVVAVVIARGAGLIKLSRRRAVAMRRSQAVAIINPPLLIATLNVHHGWPVGLAIVAAALVGTVVGLANGMFIVFFGVESLIVTLGSGTVLGGIVLWISGSSTITGISESLAYAVTPVRIFGISLVFYYALAIVSAMWFVFEFTTLGRRLLFVGGGRTVSRLSGIRVELMRIGALVASALLAVVAGTLWTGTTASADTVSFRTFLLPAFAAVYSAPRPSFPDPSIRGGHLPRFTFWLLVSPACS
jgi:ribose transport system permease protein